MHGHSTSTEYSTVLVESDTPPKLSLWVKLPTKLVLLRRPRPFLHGCIVVVNYSCKSERVAYSNLALQGFEARVFHEPVSSSKDKSPFLGCLVEVAGTPVFRCRVLDQQLLAGNRFKKEIVSRGADLLIFCVSVRTYAEECRARISAFYGSYGGDIRPLLIVVRDARTDEAATDWWRSLGLHSEGFQAIVRALPPLEGVEDRVAVGEIQSVIQTRSLDPVEAAPSGCFGWLLGRKSKLPSGEKGAVDQEDTLTKTGVWARLDA